MADYQYINSTGTIIPNTSSILSDVQTEYRAVFGADLIVTPDTVQGVLITAQALERDSSLNNNAILANQINPNIAGGVFLDSLLALTGMERTAATKTTVSGVTLTGVAGTVISAGSRAKTTAGDLFATVTSVVLDLSGNAVIDFASIEYGAIPCPAHELNTIVSNIFGWETVDNGNAGVLGSSTQSDQAARALRKNTLGFQGVALPVCLTSAVYAISGVKSLFFQENYSGASTGMLVLVTDGSTLHDTTWSLATPTNILVGTTDMVFVESELTVPDSNPYPVAKYTTTGSITLSGLTTQGGGDWLSSLTDGDIILVKDQASLPTNGAWVAHSGGWTRQAFNAAGTTIQATTNGIAMQSSSIYVCVDGGQDVDVAAALLENKSSGAGWVGGSVIDVVEPASGQIYTVKFDRPAVVGILIKVYTTNGSTPNIIQSVLDYANGLINNLAGFVVGADISPFEISGAVVTQFPNYNITKVEISYHDSVSYTTNTLPIGVNEIAYTQSSYITVVVS